MIMISFSKFSETVHTSDHATTVVILSNTNEISSRSFLLIPSACIQSGYTGAPHRERACQCPTVTLDQCGTLMQQVLCRGSSILITYVSLSRVSGLNIKLTIAYAIQVAFVLYILLYHWFRPRISFAQYVHVQVYMQRLTHGTKGWCVAFSLI